MKSENKLFANPGNILKKAAIIVFIVMCVLSFSLFVIYLVAAIQGRNGVLGFYSVLFLILGPAASYLSSLLLYGFGDLLLDTKKIREQTASPAKEKAPAAEETAE